MGSKFVEGRSVELFKAYKESSPSTPLFFILSPGVDPLKDVEALGKPLPPPRPAPAQGAACCCWLERTAGAAQPRLCTDAHQAGVTPWRCPSLPRQEAELHHRQREDPQRVAGAGPGGRGRTGPGGGSHAGALGHPAGEWGTRGTARGAWPCWPPGTPRHLALLATGHTGALSLARHPTQLRVSPGSPSLSVPVDAKVVLGMAEARGASAAPLPPWQPCTASVLSPRSGQDQACPWWAQR